MSLETENIDPNLLMTPPKTREFCNGCDTLYRRCDINELPVQEYYYQRGFCFDATVNGIKGTKTTEGFKPD